MIIGNIEFRKVGLANRHEFNVALFETRGQVNDAAADATSAASTTGSMEKDIRVSRGVELDNKINIRDIETSGCHIGCKQHRLVGCCDKVIKSLFTRIGQKLAMQRVEVGVFGSVIFQRHEMFNKSIIVVDTNTCRKVNDSFLVSEILDVVDEERDLLVGLGDSKRNTER